MLVDLLERKEALQQGGPLFQQTGAGVRRLPGHVPRRGNGTFPYRSRRGHACCWCARLQAHFHFLLPAVVAER